MISRLFKALNKVGHIKRPIIRKRIKQGIEDKNKFLRRCFIYFFSILKRLDFIVRPPGARRVKICLKLSPEIV
jgi:hypothetical protein